MATTVAVGALFTSPRTALTVSWWAKLLGTAAIGSFAVSMVAAAVLLVTLPPKRSSSASASP